MYNPPLLELGKSIPVVPWLHQKEKMIYFHWQLLVK